MTDAIIENESIAAGASYTWTPDGNILPSKLYHAIDIGGTGAAAIVMITNGVEYPWGALTAPDGDTFIKKNATSIKITETGGVNPITFSCRSFETNTL